LIVLPYFNLRILEKIIPVSTVKNKLTNGNSVKLSLLTAD